MSQRITSLRKKTSSGFGEAIPIGASAQNVTLSNGTNLQDAINELQTKSVSHIGMIIMSTTLSTMQSVIDIYGGTQWIQHSGYFLQGATTNVTSNNATSDGGQASVTLTVDQMPSHTHIQNSHNHTQNAHNHTQNSHDHSLTYTAFGGDSGKLHYQTGALASGSGKKFPYLDSTSENRYPASVLGKTATNKETTATNKETTATNNATTATNQNTGGGQAHNNIPPYKNVYIWERVA